MPDSPVKDRPGADGPSEPEEPASAVAHRSSWQLLRHRDFCLYFVGSLGSNLGTWLQNTVQVLLAYQFTHSAFFVGLVVSAQFAGTLFLSPWAAVLADRIGGRRTLIGTQLFSAVVALAMCLASRSGVLNEQFLVVGALGLGIAFALAIPVQTALVPTLVPEADTESAMAMNSVSYNSGRALAPALAVLVIAFVGPEWIFGINAVSFLLFAFVLCALKSGSCAASAHILSGVQDSRGRAKVADGIRTVRQSRRLLLLLAIVAAVTLADDPIQVLSPGLAHAMHIPGGWAAYFIAALGWGTVLGSLCPATRRKAAKRSRTSRREVVGPSLTSRRAAWSLLLLVLSVVVFALAIAPWVSLLAAFAAGAAALFTGAATQALIVGTHRNAAASVAGLWAIAWAGTKPIASLLDGWLASSFGILTAVVILALPATLLALCELGIPADMRESIRTWSLSDYVQANDSELPSSLARVLFFIDTVLTRIHWHKLPREGVELAPVGASVADVAGTGDTV